MGALQSLEDQLAGLFKDLPPLPKGAKDLLVSWWPYIALAIGVLQLLAAWGLWQAANWSSAYLDSINRLSQYATGTSIGYSDTDRMIIYGGIILLVVNAVIFFMAYSPLTKRAKRGWDLLFLASVINVVYGFIQIFMSGRGVGSFLVSLVGSAIGFYLLFQIRERYAKGKPAKKV